MSNSTLANKKQCQSLDYQTNKHNSMETRKDRMAHEYVPKLHDYVILASSKDHRRGGSILLGMNTSLLKLVSKRNQSVTDTHHKHRKNHTLIVCQNWYWHELEYVKSRKDFYDCET